MKPASWSIQPRGALLRIALVAGIFLTPAGFTASNAVPPVEDGYDLWLRYRPVADAALRTEYRAAVTQLVVQQDSPTIRAAVDELTLGLKGLLDVNVRGVTSATVNGSLIIGTPAGSKLIASLPLGDDIHRAGPGGFVIKSMTVAGKRATVIAAAQDVGVLYGTFRFLRQLQTAGSVRQLAIVSAPKIGLRMLDHWDNLNRSVERGYAGQSLWNWDSLPAVLPPRYRDYARANASIGLNGTSVMNVNANAKILTPEYLAKVAALAGVFRPYGIRVFLTARFSAPIEIGGLKTADPLDPSVRTWWKQKADEIYGFIPDFGGFLVKANSEGQPGPQDYKRTHADGANMLADAVASHGGIVMWRAFVYSGDVPVDRVKQAYDEFTPLDGTFRENVLVQVKNGPLDFQPREPFSPLFGAMPKTPLVMEFQITKEYLGQDTHLAFLAPLFKETLDADTWVKGKGSTVAKVIDGSLHAYTRTGIAGVANVGTDRNWTGSQFNAANWYAFGRLAWDDTLSASEIADEWIRMTFSNDATVVTPVREMMLMSREAVVNYMTPLGLAHQMAAGHHYGPGPWVTGGRGDQTSTYFNHADSLGLGFDRSPTGSNAVSQYAPPLRELFASRQDTPDSLLLWFHHVGWSEQMRSGRTLWNELIHRYDSGIDSVRSMERRWNTVQGKIDSGRFDEMKAFLTIQEKEAQWWRDASLLYWQTYSRLPIPADEMPAHPLSFYRSLRCPRDRNHPRCPEIY